MVRDQPLDLVGEFKYLGKMLDKSENDWLELYSNLSKASCSEDALEEFWGGREGADVRKSALLYHAVVQAILLYGSETWVLTEPMLVTLEGVHMKFIINIAQMPPKG